MLARHKKGEYKYFLPHSLLIFDCQKYPESLILWEGEAPGRWDSRCCSQRAPELSRTGDQSQRGSLSVHRSCSWCAGCSWCLWELPRPPEAACCDSDPGVWACQVCRIFSEQVPWCCCNRVRDTRDFWDGEKLRRWLTWWSYGGETATWVIPIRQSWHPQGERSSCDLDLNFSTLTVHKVFSFLRKVSTCQIVCWWWMKEPFTDIRNARVSDVEDPEVPEHPESRWQGQPVLVSAARTDKELAGVGRYAVQGEVVLIVAATHNLVIALWRLVKGCFCDETILFLP